MAERREANQAPEIASYTPPPIVRAANGTIKQPITAEPADVPRVAAPRLYGTPIQQQQTLSEINAGEIRKPIDQQAIYVNPETLPRTRVVKQANIFQRAPKIIVPENRVMKQASIYQPATKLIVPETVTPIVTQTFRARPIISETVTILPTTKDVVKETEIIPAPTNNVKVSQPVAEIVKESRQADETGFSINPYFTGFSADKTGFSINPYFIYAIIGAVLLVIFLLSKKKK